MSKRQLKARWIVEQAEDLKNFMGYYTEFHLQYDFMANVPDKDMITGLVTSYIKERGMLGICEGVIKPGEQIYLGEEKWYNHDFEMRTMSMKFPMCLFTLLGKGEDPGDVWKKYFFCGRVQTEMAQITYSPFDINELERDDDYESFAKQHLKDK